MSTVSGLEIANNVEREWRDRLDAAVRADEALLRQVLEALERSDDFDETDAVLAAIKSLRERLAQPMQEPVLVVEREPDYWSGGHFHQGTKPHIDPTKVWRLPIDTKLYTAPQPRQWVELTEAEIFNADPNPHNMFDAERLEFGRRLEAVMREKNA